MSKLVHTRNGPFLSRLNFAFDKILLRIILGISSLATPFLKSTFHLVLGGSANNLICLSALPGVKNCDPDSTS